ncbi:MAG: hypothetical protein ACD_37C00267G0011 [uncultured bacterium]|nr:MAG: hypothetical protein ACD_37C00267G0011 [uncultured bacterium]
MEAYEIIKEPIISEKATEMNTKFNQVVFKVDKRANKYQIKKAVEKIYEKNGVRVDKVRTMNVPGKLKRVRSRAGRLSGWKKAIVSLKKGSKLEFQ